MSMILGTPTMTQETLWPDHEGSPHRKPWSRTRAVLDVLARPVWTEQDRDRLDRITDRFDTENGHTCYLSDPCEACDLIGRINPLIEEWDRIRQAPPIPSTAQLRNILRRPDKTVRAARLYRDLMERSSARRRIVLASVKRFKTPGVQYKHERKAEESDPTLRRLDRAMNRLRRIQPDVASLARTVH